MDDDKTLPFQGAVDKPIDTQQSDKSDRSGESEWEMIGPYRLVETIGEGGMGSVWKAEQLEPVQRQVALKLIKANSRSKEVVARFEAERQALALMDHPNIARVFDAGVTDRGPFFVMELVQGTRFTDYCDKRQLSLRERLSLFIPVCEAVQHAHLKGIIHRDLKPSNVLVATNNERPVPKVIDFGLAKALRGQVKLTEQTIETEVGQIVGTLNYMSPEQAQLNEQDVDTRTDVYALGIMLYELMTGSTPVSRDTLNSNSILEILRIVREDEPPRPSQRFHALGESGSSVADLRKVKSHQLISVLRGDLDWIIMKAVEKDRGRRYQSVSALADDIQRFLAGEAVSARPPSAIYRIRKTVRKHRTAAIASAIVLATLVAGLTTTTILYQKARSEAIRATNAQSTTNAVNRLMSDIFESADPDVALGRELTVQDVLDAASSRINADTELSPVVESQVRVTIGNTYHNLGKFDAALQQLSKAVELERSRVPVKPTELAHNLAQWAGCLYDAGDYERAIEASRECQELLRSQDTDSKDLVLALRTWGDSLSQLGQPETATDQLQLARRTAVALPGSTGQLETANVLNSLGVLYHSQGNAKEAVACFRNCLEIREESLSSQHPLTASTLANLSAALFSDGQAEEAKTALKESIEIRESVLPENHPDIGSSYHTLGAIEIGQGKFETAIQSLEKAVAIREVSLPSDHKDIIPSLKYLAFARLKTGNANASLQSIDFAMQRIGSAKLEPSERASHFDLIRFLLGQINQSDDEETRARAVELLSKLDAMAAGPDSGTKTSGDGQPSEQP